MKAAAGEPNDEPDDEDEDEDRPDDADEPNGSLLHATLGLGAEEVGASLRGC